MKLTARRTDLLSAVSIAAQVSDDAQAWIEAGPGGRIVSVVSDECEARIQLKCESDAEVRAAFPIQLLARWLRMSAAETVVMIFRHGECVVHGDAERLSFLAAEPTRTVEPHDHGSRALATIPADEFRSAMRRVLTAAERSDQSRAWATRSVRLATEPLGFSLSATDEFRMAVEVCEHTTLHTKPFAVLISPHAAKFWLVAARRTEALVSISLTDDGAYFGTEQLTAKAKAVAGRFPPWTARSHWPNRVKLPAEALSRAVRLALAASGGDEEIDLRMRWVRLSLAPGSLTLRGENAEDGSSSANEISLPNYTGPSASLTIDGNRLKEYLDAIDDESRVLFRWDQPDQPVEFSVGVGSRYLMAPRKEVTPPARCSGAPG